MGNLIQKILSCIREEKRPTPTVERTEIPKDDLVAVLKEEIPKWDIGVTRIAMDGTYYAPKNAKEVRKALSYYQNEKLEYERAVYDCENFAMTATGLFSQNHGVNTVGVVIDWSAENPHAYNIIVHADGSVEWFEPQSDTFIGKPWENDAKRYDLSFGRIII